MELYVFKLILYRWYGGVFSIIIFMIFFVIVVVVGVVVYWVVVFVFLSGNKDKKI